MLIGLCGLAQAGKDTVCARLAEVAEAEVVRHAFADKVYACAAACIGVEVEVLRDLKTNPAAVVTLEVMDGPQIGRPSTLTIREYLQRLGTEGHRDLFGQDFWIKQVSPDLGDGRVHVVTDVRFDNEAEHLRRLGGVMARVIGPPEVNVGDTHSSEAGVSARLLDLNVFNSVRGDGFKALDAQLPGLLWAARKAAGCSR